MTRLNQTITRWQGMGLIATTLLGTGVFIIPQLTIQHAGDHAIWAWVVLLLAILPLAYVFAELGRKFTHAAGPAYFVSQAFGQTAGRIIGLLFLFAVPPGAAAALIMTFKFLDPLITLSAQQAIIAELAVFLLLFFINRRGLQLSGRIQLGLTLIIATGFLLKGTEAALSSLAGGLICAVPNAYFMYKAFRYTGARQINQVLKSFYQGGTWKLLLTAVGFGLAFKFIEPLDFFALFGTFVAVQCVQFFASKIANL